MAATRFRPRFFIIFGLPVRLQCRPRIDLSHKAPESSGQGKSISVPAFGLCPPPACLFPLLRLGAGTRAESSTPVGGNAHMLLPGNATGRALRTESQSRCSLLWRWQRADGLLSLPESTRTPTRIQDRADAGPPGKAMAS